MSYFGAAIAALAAAGTLAGGAGAGGPQTWRPASSSSTPLTLTQYRQGRRALHRPGAGQKHCRRRARHSPPADRPRAAGRGKLRPVHPGADSRQVRPGTADRQASQYADHRRRVRDPAGRRGAVRDAQLEVPDRCRAGQGARQDRGLNTANDIGDVMTGTLAAEDGYKPSAIKPWQQVVPPAHRPRPPGRRHALGGRRQARASEQGPAESNFS